VSLSRCLISSCTMQKLLTEKKYNLYAYAGENLAAHRPDVQNKVGPADGTTGRDGEDIQSLPGRKDGFVMRSAWDAGSAIILMQAGFSGLQPHQRRDRLLARRQAD